MTSVKITECATPDELYCHFSGEHEAQDTYIELDVRHGTLLADYNGVIGSGIPFEVFHGFERRYAIPLLTGDAANRVMREIAPLADRILADWEEHWDGNNMVARLGEDARAAEEEIEQHLGVHAGADAWVSGDQGFPAEDLIAEWDIDGAVNGCEAEEYGITAETSDERLDEIAQKIAQELAECSGSKVAVVDGLDEYLRGVRRDLTV
ncbi:hypothetical protein ACTWJ8_40345 (plasmid) [Streptomyces sp. SDT5-1]|uniref:hypothetical protein n=1 Tax=Streptomyces sp. SDT5-1 TaxID=3406418 RepID=UPI003FD33CC2